jgi:hypothetical protein
MRGLPSLFLLGACACGGGDEASSASGIVTGLGGSATATTTTDTAGSGETGTGEDAGDGDTTASTSSTTTGDGDGDGTTQTSSGDGDGDGTAGPNWSMTHIDYSGAVSQSVDFDDCQFCDVNDVGTHTLLRFQQDGGWTIWALYVPGGATVGTHPLTQDYSGAYATLSANSSSLPSAAQGMYFGDTNVGTVTLTSADTSPGGIIAGSIDVTMTKGTVNAHLTATFQGTMP